MSYKTILAILQSEEDIERVLDCAIPMAVRFEAHLIGLHTEPLPIAYSSPMGYPDVGLIATETDISRETAGKLKARFDKRTGSDGISAEWRGLESLSGDSAISGLESARSADIVVAQQSDPDAKSRGTADIAALIAETSRPVILVPYAGRIDTGFRKILVAWNGSRQAASAVFDALPLLKAADAVEVLCIDSEEMGMPGGQIAATLARHGVSVTIKAEPSGGTPVAACIENRLVETGADLLVMGGYGHSRLSEFLFGGVTRSILLSMVTPTLISR